MLWIKALHLLAVISWLAGIFYLPRIFVHYSEGRAAGEDVRRLVIMADRLYSFMSLMAVFAIASGAWLVLRYYLFGPSIAIKLLFVVGLIGYHWLCYLLLERMQRGGRFPSGTTLRWLNEAALLLVVPILILVIVRPFG